MSVRHFQKDKKIVLQGTTHLSFELNANSNEKLVLINETHQNTNLVLPTLYVPKGNRLVSSSQPNYVVRMPFPTAPNQVYTFVPPASNFGASVIVTFEPKNIFTVPFVVRLFKDGGTVIFRSVNVGGIYYWRPFLTPNSTSRLTNLVTASSGLGDNGPITPFGLLSEIMKGMLQNVGWGLLSELESLFGIQDQNQITYEIDQQIFQLLQNIASEINSDFTALVQDGVNATISDVNDGFNSVINLTNFYLGFPQTPINTFYDYGQGADPNALFSTTTPVQTYRQIINTGKVADDGLIQVYTNTKNLLDTYTNFTNFQGPNPSGQSLYYIQQLHNLISAGQQLAMYDTSSYQLGPTPKGFYPPWLSENILQLQTDLLKYLPNGYNLWNQFLQSYQNNIVVYPIALGVYISDGEVSDYCTITAYEPFYWCSLMVNGCEDGTYTGWDVGVKNPPLYDDGLGNGTVILENIMNTNDPLFQIPVASAGFPPNNIVFNPPSPAPTNIPFTPPILPTPPNIIGTPDGLGGWTCQPTITQEQLAEARNYATNYLINYFGNPTQVLDIMAQIGGLSCTSIYSNSIYITTSCTTLTTPSYQGAVRGTPFGSLRFSASSLLDQIGVNLMESNLYSVSQNTTTKYFNETYPISGFDGNLKQYYSSSIFEQFVDWNNICCPVNTVNVSSAFFGSVSESVGGGNVPATLGERKFKCYGTTTSNNLSSSIFLDTASSCKPIVPGMDLVSSTGPVLVDKTFIGGNGFPALKYQTLNPQINSALSAIDVGVIECLCGIGNLEGVPTPGCPGLYTNTTCYPNKMSLQFVVNSSWNAKPFPTIQNIYRSQFFMTDGYTTVPVNINYDGTNGCPSYGTNSSSPYIYSFTSCYISNPNYKQGLLGACVNLSATVNKSTFTTGDKITIEDWEMIIEGTQLTGGFCPSDNYSSQGAASQSYYSAFASLQLPVQSWTLLYYPNFV